MSNRFTYQIAFTLVIGTAASGCNMNLGDYAGDYAGKMTVRPAAEGGSRSPGVPSSLSVHASSNGPKKLTLESTSDSQKFEWNIEAGPASELTLNTSGIIQYSGHLHHQSGTNCFESLSIHQSSHAKICLSDSDTQFDISNSESSVTLNLTRPPVNGGSNGLPVLETPKDYTGAELRDRAKGLSFSSREEFEKLVHAKLTVRLNYLNLLPHISMGSALAIGTFSGPTSLIGSIGDLAPFLLPSRWITARESQRMFDAQKFSVAIMQIDAMQIVEGLGMMVGRDNVLHAQLKSDRDLQTQLTQEVLNAEQTGRVAPGSSLAISSAANTLDQTISNLESQIALEMTQIAQATGFINPNAIVNLNVAPLGDIHHPEQFDLKDLETRSLEHSPELGQMDALLEAAKLEKIGRGFQWLDPSGDPAGGFGAALPTYIEIGQSNIRELLIAKDQLNSTLLRTATDAFNDYSGWQDSYRLAQDGIDLQVKRIDSARQALNSNFAGDAVEEIRDALEQLPVNHANLTTAEYAWYNAVSRINRLLRVGPYQPAPTHNSLM